MTKLDVELNNFLEETFGATHNVVYPWGTWIYYIWLYMVV